MLPPTFEPCLLKAAVPDIDLPTSIQPDGRGPSPPGNITPPQKAFDSNHPTGRQQLQFVRIKPVVADWTLLFPGKPPINLRELGR